MTTLKAPTETPASGPGARSGGPGNGAPARSRRRPPTGSTWPGAVAVAAAVLFAAGSLAGVFEGWRWLEHATVTVAATSATAGVLRSRGAASPWPTLGALAALGLTLTVQFFADTAVLGIVPTTSTIQRAFEIFPQANEAVLSQSAPVLAETPLVFLTCLSVGLVAVTVDLIAFGLGFPALSAIPLAVVLAAASLIKPAGAGLGHVAATGVGFLLILGAARLAETSQVPGGTLRSGLGRQAVLIGVASVAAMLVVPLALPGFNTGLLPEGRRLYLWGEPTGVNPVLNLGNNLRSPLGLTTIEYFTDSEEPLYLRTAVIGDLNAPRWQPSDDDVARLTVDTRLPAPGGESGAGATMVAESLDVSTRISTGNYQSPWLPLPRGATTVAGLDGRWGWYGETATLFADEGTSSLDQDFTIGSLVPVLSPELLEASDDALSADPGIVGRMVPDVYASVPGDLPAIVRDTAVEVVAEAGAESAYERAVALQNHLRGVDYTYSEETPLEQGYDGNGLAVVEAFLEQKSGYCIHYSSAMALMSRALGIPSRIAIGYAPGRTNGQVETGPDGQELVGYQLSPRSAHAWPELYFAGIGWVPFEPTPGRGAAPSYAPEQPGPAAQPTEDPLLPEASVGATTSEESSSEAEPSADEAPGADGTGGAANLIGFGALGVFALLGPHGIRRILRARRLGRIRAMDDAAPRRIDALRDGPLAAWEELAALGTDYGLGMREAETAHDYAARLHQRAPETARSLETLRDAYERVRYARPIPAGPRDTVAKPPAPSGRDSGKALELALRDVGIGLSGAASPGARARATGLPASLFVR
ncbi:transglutaminase TgpA family protein [Arthrobacter sp. KK5.5]|uniref:transglutaminase TgpA family protein n=1 Tax=Arthrobacter sp. KK5.5 TaxID=3373084 RepID=UPI003EE6B225